MATSRSPGLRNLCWSLLFITVLGYMTSLKQVLEPFFRQLMQSYGILKVFVCLNRLQASCTGGLRTALIAVKVSENLDEMQQSAQLALCRRQLCNQ